MKGKKRKKRKVSLFIVTLTILIPLLFSMPVVLADSQTYVSFDPLPNGPPDRPINSYPLDGAINVEIPVTLEVVVNDESNRTINVYFYNAYNDSLIGVDYNVFVDWSTATATVNWSGLQKGTSYSWYAVADDLEYENTSRIWSFSTKPASGPTPPPSPGYTPPPNRFPIANITGPLTGYVNETVIFCAYYSYDSDGYIAGYRWDFNNDGLFDTDWEKDLFISHIYFHPDNYTVKLQVKDDDGATSMDSYIITIIALEPDQQLPVAQPNGPYEGFLHENISFNGTGSYDPDGIIVKYEWKFGDRNTGNGVNPRHKYDQAGEYIVILTVTDDDGLTDIAATKATIISIIKEVYINDIKHYLVDTSGDNCIDAFYNSTTKEITATNMTDGGLYLIDEDGNGDWDYIYDPGTEEISLYLKEKIYPLGLLTSIIIVLATAIIVAVVILRKRRYSSR